MIKKMQGDENALKLWVVDVDADEEKPEFLPFDTKNLDKEYDYTEKSVQQNIGGMFRIPPILRGIDVGAGFGSLLVGEAYQFMSSVTSNERRMLEVAFRDLMEFYTIKFNNYSIAPLQYVMPSNIKPA
jgi:hypothetical protein